MAREHYQSPPAADDFAPDFGQHLMPHEAGARYMPDNYSTDQHFIPSGTNSGYVTPDPNQMLKQQGMSYLDPFANQYDPGSMVGTDLYGHPLYYPQETQEFYPTPTNQYPSPVPLQYVSSPPTPSGSDLSSSGKRKRPARSHAANGNASRSSDSPKAKKSRPAKGEKAKTPKLNAPLSVLTKDSDVPLKDMNAWVHRPAEERLREVEQRAGNRITRPMNSFMLYRSAYADRTKRWCTQNNHQVVSSVSGESWPMEPKEIRDLYTEYARIERDNHQKAHPGYKFSPMKPGSAARKRKDASDDDEEQSELESLDHEYLPSTRMRSRRPRGATPEANWSGGHQVPYGYTSIGPSKEQSSYPYANPNKPLPVPMVDQGHNHYYQTVIRQTRNPNVEDVLYHQTEMPGNISYGTTQALSSVPGGGHHALLDDTFADGSANLEPADFESKVDPSLGYDFGDIPGNFGDEQQFPNQASQSYQSEPTASLTRVDPEFMGGNNGTEINDDALADFLKEANGS